MTHHQRRRDSRDKFLWGLLLEKSQWALTPQGYRDSDSAYQLAIIIAHALAQEPGWEHRCYQHGKIQWWLLEKSAINLSHTRDGSLSSKQRYHHLVRLGADMMRAGLNAYSKTTVLGALLYQKKQDTAGD